MIHCKKTEKLHFLGGEVWEAILMAYLHKPKVHTVLSYRKCNNPPLLQRTA
ncbi:protein of unknown function [Alteromonas macleodii]|uniref:Uncharacterized protein n=1 Tax=Alteromonas macleodii TaxID=28108 RepID=A0A6T9Y4D7_ALTMA|nr:protein of unknown function [Alteromonas macleodii]